MRLFIFLLGLVSLSYAQQRVYQDFGWNQGLSIGAAMTLNGLASYHLSHSDSSSHFSKSPMPWDQGFVGQNNSTMLNASNIFPFANLVFLGKSWSDKNFTRDIALYAEVLSWSSFINISVRNLKLWPRPLMSDPQTDRSSQTSEAWGSFYSGHAANSFAFATAFTHIQLHQYPGNSNNKWWIAGAYGVAGATAITRLYSGKHYPTDILTGAVLGSGIAWLVMELRHLTPQPQEDSVSSAQGGASDGLIQFDRMSFTPMPNGLMVGYQF